MPDNISCYFRAVYRVPSKERTFLESGFGIRDVRGPYINQELATLKIPHAMLSELAPSSLWMILSTSNRCPTIKASISITAGKDSKIVVLHRNSSSEVSFELTADKDKDFLIFFQLLPQTFLSAKDFYEIVSLDELIIERKYNAVTHDDLDLE